MPFVRREVEVDKPRLSIVIVVVVVLANVLTRWWVGRDPAVLVQLGANLVVALALFAVVFATGILKPAWRWQGRSRP